MADYTAIYEAGESVVNYLKSVMTPEPIAKKEHIGLCEPQSPGDFQLTVWIYNIQQVRDTGTGTGFHLDPDDPSIERFAPMELTLNMLVSSHSKATAMQKYTDEYRVIGRAMQALRDIPTLPSEFLSGTLAESKDPITLAVLKLGSEEMSRIWNNSEKTVCPSFGIEVSKIFIRSERTRTAAPRVASAEFSVRHKTDFTKR
ncbi:MAG: DUF4255 domain-containing protein [Oscillospiraceae bacterium]|nr:DUF4255 domain-containing protein [Oscillospiraceae bacterium]